MGKAARSSLLLMVLVGFLWLSGQPAKADQPAADPDTLASVERFVRSVYAPYIGDAPHPPGLESLSTPRLAELIRRDRHLADGGIGLIDHDLICRCQDYGRFELESLTFSAPTKNTAAGEVRFVNFGEVSVVSLKLDLTPQGWRIADISFGDESSLVRFLEAELPKPR